MTAAAVDPEKPRRLLEEVLARPEFRRGGEDLGNWLDALLARIAAVAGDLPAWTGKAVTALVLALAALLVWRLLAEGGPRRAAAGAQGSGDADTAAHEPADATRAAGLEAMRAGRFAEAVVLLFRAMIARLAERNLLLPDPSRTNREHVRDLAARPREADALRAALPCFERVRYGERAVERADAERVVAAAAVVFAEGEAP